MELEKKKFILDIILAVFVVISLGISIRSCRTSEKAEKTATEAIEISKKSNEIAKEANKISHDALETSQYQFLQINRPYITLAPKKFKDGLYWKVTQQENTVLIVLQYEIKNVGNVSAKNISFPDKIAVGPKMKLKDYAYVFYKKPSKVSLGPGDDFIITPNMLMEYENEEEAKINFAHFISDKSDGTTLLLSVNYTNELDESQKYRTFMQNRIHNDEALILKSEMIVLTEDE